MTAAVTVALPIADRRTSTEFYRHLLELEAAGAPADDGIPEPLQFHINVGLHLILIPTGGFSWVIDPAGTVAEPGVVNALLTLSLPSVDAVDRAGVRARAAGGGAPHPAEYKEWGYRAIVADPDGHIWQILDQTAPPLTMPRCVEGLQHGPIVVIAAPPACSAAVPWGDVADQWWVVINLLAGIH
jgi:predicted lactoylglutathione lyase